MIRRPPRSTLDRSSAASDVYKRQYINNSKLPIGGNLSFVFKDTFYAGFKGGLIKNMKMMYDDFLWDFEIRNAQMEGLSFFDLGEVPQNHTGLKKYKKKWGAEEIPIYHLYPENVKIIKSEFDSSDQDTSFRKYWNAVSYTHLTLPTSDLV